MKKCFCKFFVGVVVILALITIVYQFEKDKLGYKYKYAPEIFSARFHLADDYSRHVYDNAYKFYANNDSKCLDTVLPLSYENNHKYVFVHPGDYVLDGGVSGDVSFTIFFLEQAGLDGHVFGIEPNPNLQEKIKNDLKDYPNFTLHQYALWNENGTGEFDLGENPDDNVNFDAHVVHKNYQTNSNVISVKFIKLDDFVKENNIDKLDLIKFDLEGSELPALQASVNTIKKFKPDLILSCHLPYDYFKLINLLHSISPEYKIYMVQYEGGTESWKDFMIFATVRNSDEKLANPNFDLNY